MSCHVQNVPSHDRNADSLISALFTSVHPCVPFAGRRPIFTALAQNMSYRFYISAHLHCQRPLKSTWANCCRDSTSQQKHSNVEWLHLNPEIGFKQQMHWLKYHTIATPGHGSLLHKPLPFFPNGRGFPLDANIWARKAALKELFFQA